VRYYVDETDIRWSNDIQLNYLQQNDTQLSLAEM